MVNKLAGNKRVFVEFQNNSLVNVDYNLSFNSENFDTVSPRFYIVDFKTSQAYIYQRWGLGNNKNKVRVTSDSSIVTKDASSNSDGNGTLPPVMNVVLNPNDRNYILLSNPEDVTTIEFKESSVGGITLGGILSIRNMPNLREIIGSTTVSNSSHLYNLDVLNAPLEKIQILCGRSSIGNIKMSGFNIPTLKYLKLTNIPYTSDNFLLHLPEGLNYFSGNHHSWGGVRDLADFFINTNRMGLELTLSSNVTQGYSYRGGAIFPTHITESNGREVEYILHVSGHLTSTTVLTPNMVSQFLIDFANQVQSVTLVNKRIRFRNMPANTSYTDASQPLFTTYASALSHITGTLGITVQFT